MLKSVLSKADEEEPLVEEIADNMTTCEEFFLCENQDRTMDRNSVEHRQI